jgi:cell division initiation protein
MKITPAAIRQRSFETGFRGYEKKEVAAFLDEVSEVVEKLHQENMELRTKLQNTEAEAKRLKDVEDSLFRTLKTAEDTGASIIEEANEAADLIIAEANHTAEHANAHANQVLSQARKQAEEQSAVLISAAEKKAKDTIFELRESMQGLVRSYEGLAEQRELLVKSLKRLSQDALNQIDLSESHFTRIDAKAHQRAIEELSRSNSFVLSNIATIASQVAPVRTVSPEAMVVTQDKILADERPVEEILEEEEELENHDQAPDVQVEEEVMEEIPDEIEEEEETEEIPVIAEIPRVVAEAPKPIEELPKAAEDTKKQSGSFFDDL